MEKYPLQYALDHSHLWMKVALTEMNTHGYTSTLTAQYIGDAVCP